ncbi:MAG: hypothetical protein FWF78_08215 [Defluviitaleaceae bacterium]|nr:hypothetical protein [Defluviitaleaceae bacterium]
MKKIFLLPLLFILTSCMTENPPQIIGIPRSVTVSETVIKAQENAPQPFTIFYRSEATPAMYEPIEGIYLAAWLTEGTAIREFEYAAGKRHAVFVHEMDLGEEIPISWVLHCIASRATPMLIIHPPTNPDLDDIPEMELLIHLAHRLGSFNLPMFIVFYPDETHTRMPTEYTLLFRQARNAFHAHAPMAAFVWVAPSHTATPSNPFYPGHFAVDWVALPLLACWDTERGFTDVLTNFETFYHSFHQHKPLMALPLGVSHFTRGDYRYRVRQASEEIERIYDALQNFPRLGLIAYADNFTLNRMYRDDFSISTEPQLIAAYNIATTSDHFLQTLERSTLSENLRWTRSVHHGYVWEEIIYIPTALELSTPTSRQTIEINYSTVIDSRRISGKKITACFHRHVIYVDNLP